MLTTLLLPGPSSLRLNTIAATSERILLDLTATQPTAFCPDCHGESTRIHSRYRRTVGDLPWAKTPVVLHIHVRRFVCPTADCSRITFTETLPDVVLPSARRTVRLVQEQRQLGFDLGGEAGARTAKRQGMPTSPDTLLRLVRHEATAVRPTPRHLGVDDFALRKGQVYGTILVDLDQHQPIDLLPDRSAETLAQWLAAHPGVEVIARDRANDYAEGARRGAPDAVQVADRFHLLQNVREMLQRVLERHQSALQAATATQPTATNMVALPAQELTPADVAPPVPDPSPAAQDQSRASAVVVTLAEPHMSTSVEISQARRERRMACYREVRALHAAGLSLRSIAAQLQLSRKTVRRYVVADQFPERATPRPQPSKLDPFLPYLEQQLMAGQDNSMHLWRELRDQQGYRGSRALVSRWVARHRHLVPPPDPATPKPRRRGRPPAPHSASPTRPRRNCSARQAAWLLLQRPDDLDTDDQVIVERLCHQTQEIATAQRVAQEFSQIVRTQQADKFDEWVVGAEASGIPEVGSFVAGLLRDKAAVVAALSLPYSSGQVEGQITRVKLLKRTMYGRANFDLLRQRVLARTA